MFKIAVCDDDEAVTALIRNCIDANSMIFGEKYMIETFNDGLALDNELKNGVIYDLIFLDIMMPEINGLDIGQNIRSLQENYYTQIVYISFSHEYVMNLFELQPMNFLIKPLKEDDIVRTVKKAIYIVKGYKRAFEYYYNKEMCKELYENIYHISSDGRMVILHTSHGDKKFYGKLDAVYKRLDNHNFVMVHKSHIVNYMHISKIDSNGVQMVNGDYIPISRSRKEELIDIWRLREH